MWDTSGGGHHLGTTGITPVYVRPHLHESNVCPFYLSNVNQFAYLNMYASFVFPESNSSWVTLPYGILATKLLESSFGVVGETTKVGQRIGQIQMGQGSCSPNGRPIYHFHTLGNNDFLNCCITRKSMVADIGDSIGNGNGCGVAHVGHQIVIIPNQKPIQITFRGVYVCVSFGVYEKQISQSRKVDRCRYFPVPSLVCR